MSFAKHYQGEVIRVVVLFNDRVTRRSMIEEDWEEMTLNDPGRRIPGSVRACKAIL